MHLFDTQTTTRPLTCGFISALKSTFCLSRWEKGWTQTTELQAISILIAEMTTTTLNPSFIGLNCICFCWVGCVISISTGGVLSWFSLLIRSWKSRNWSNKMCTGDAQVAHLYYEDDTCIWSYILFLWDWFQNVGCFLNPFQLIVTILILTLAFGETDFWNWDSLSQGDLSLMEFYSFLLYVVTLLAIIPYF